MSVDLLEAMSEISKVLEGDHYPGYKLLTIKRIVEPALEDAQVQDLAGELDLIFNSHHTKPDYQAFLSTAKTLVSKGWRKVESK